MLEKWKIAIRDGQCSCSALQRYLSVLRLFLSALSHYSPNLVCTLTHTPSPNTNRTRKHSTLDSEKERETLFFLSFSVTTQHKKNVRFRLWPEMQEIHSIGGGRFFGGGDRRLRSHHQNHQQQPPLKCPRCDSLNTKFCYYNNYNLSQPRHFCKSCRRYWTKGGVLRNVPVGGGCRKSKRSNKPKTTTSDATATATATSSNNNIPSSSSETALATAPTPPQQPPPPLELEHNSHSHSSGESSTLTVAATEAMSAPTSNAVSNNNLLLDNNRESKMFANLNPYLEQSGSGGIFSDIESFSSLVNSNNQALGFGFGNNNNNISILDATSFRFGISVTNPHGNDQVLAAPGGGHGQWQQQQQNHHEFATASFLDHTVPLEFSSLQHKAGHQGGFGPLDWQPGGDQGLFDLPNTVDQPYWTHHTHWSDQDNPPSLFHLP